MNVMFLVVGEKKPVTVLARLHSLALEGPVSSKTGN